MISKPTRSAFASPLWLDLARVVAAIQADLQAQRSADKKMARRADDPRAEGAARTSGDSLRQA
jgi:hypothetical protein